MTLHYVDSEHPCGAEACSIDGARSVPDIPPSGIQRIVSMDGQRLTVVADSGAIWHLEAARIAGVTTQHRLTTAGALLGGAVGFGISGLVALLAASGPPADAPVSFSGPSVSKGTAVAVTVVGTLLGAAIGAAIGHNNLAADYFDFGGSGRSFEPRPTFSR